ncbi:extracellular solute-binding protein [Microbacterium imperiale]|uniref:Sugar ABC transporter substrate-binding protein n=1 Tax=Microbacterium imperiale TaxID=33884 RepID=A0A9W6HI91_9MICO|nr:extracellular solute-binding protein [Microbacterium imperiale]MBP2421726.1 multiple sugar transport system substrate-binding protein [Microbacterium imperiale]MDS0199172.1 extracellular solute-binding protein [Microbacterium imperiale]BFE42068.1 ABC transporter substrate-binding protein [Microbacterium imperiale]GLJ81021.1 sugar ABC transporter substrate-binding protein [Microbacterium imperiale]
MRTSRVLAAASVVALAATLGACAPDDGVPTLTWYINPDDGGQAKIAAACTDAADGAYRIQTSLLPRDAASQREQLARRLAAGDRSLDIMSLDPPFIPELAEPGFLDEVPEQLQNTDGIVQGAVDSASWDGELVTVPFWANTQLLWYRQSVVEAAGLDMSQPVTWDEIMTVAEEQDLRLGVQGALAESLTVWINALVASSGGTILENPEAPADELRLGLDSDAGRAAADIIGRIGSEGLGGPGLPTADENANMNLFQGEQGSFMVNWPFVWPAMTGADPEIADDLGWAVYPRVDADTPAAPPVGGINLGVGAFSENPDLAWQAVECIVQPANQAEYFVTNGNPPSNAAAYDDPRVQEEFPMADTIRESLELGVPRPQTPYYNEVSIGLQRTWHPPSAVTPDSTPRTSSEFILAVLRGERLL